MLDSARRLDAGKLATRVGRLGFRADDAAATVAAARAVEQAGDHGLVEELAERLLPRVGLLDQGQLPDPWDCAAGRDERYGTGVLALLALVATAEDVVAYQRRRGITEDQAWRSLADLGQQVWVHRQTYGGFGLHTQDWLRLAWSGNLHWLGRLQFNLQRSEETGAWEASTHIPQTGPLSPASVDDAFTRAERFFDQHFGEYPVANFHCFSWLLDPHLTTALPADSNLAQFAARWHRYGEPANGDGDALFFVFHRRGPVNLGELPRTTTLQRVILGRLQSGRHWEVWHGRVPRGAAGR